jgi:Ca-activated chloride channel family protein
MPAAWEAVILKVNLFLFSSVLLCATVSAQTTVNDVHIVPRRAAVPHGISTIHAVSDGSLSVIRTNVKLVLVPVSVTDAMQRVVTGLSRDNFEVFDGKKPQTIQDFSSEDVPVSVGIILDSSGSMQDKWDRVRDAVNQFCDTANPDDEFFMVVFSDKPRLSHDFTTSTEDLQKDLLFTQPKGRTALLDAIQMGLRKMESAKYGKRALLIISDGGDNHSRYSEKEIKSLAKESDVMIYSIGVFDRYVPTMEEAQGPELLTQITEPTGGRAFTVESATEMPEIARHIGMELRTQYVLAYRPQDVPHDGRWHRIKVKLRLPKRLPFLQAHAKTGYYASQN